MLRTNSAGHGPASTLTPTPVDQRVQCIAVLDAPRSLRYGLAQLNALHHARFEEAIRDLMCRDGCRDAVGVGGGEDLGADVKATAPFGRRWVIQCKHRRSAPEPLRQVPPRDAAAVYRKRLP